MSEQADDGAQIAGLTPERRRVFEDVHDGADRALRSRDGTAPLLEERGAASFVELCGCQIDNLVLYRTELRRHEWSRWDSNPRPLDP